MERVVAALLLALAAACAVRSLAPSALHEPDLRSAARASEPDPPDGTDLLRFTPDERDLGRIDGGASARVAFPWRRGGAGDLRVFALETDCGCAVASGLPDLVPEGASGTLVLDLRGRSRPGPFAHVVRLRVDRAPDDVLRVRVRGFVGRAIDAQAHDMDERPGARAPPQVEHERAGGALRHEVGQARGHGAPAVGLGLSLIHI